MEMDTQAVFWKVLSIMFITAVDRDIWAVWMFSEATQRSKTRLVLYCWFDLFCVLSDGPSPPELIFGHSVCAEQYVCRAAAGPEAGSGGPPDGPPGEPAVLGLLLGAAAGDALPEDRWHSVRLLGPDGVPQVVRQQQTLGAVLGPGPGLLGHLCGLRAVPESRSGTETHHRGTLPHYWQ